MNWDFKYLLFYVYLLDVRILYLQIVWVALFNKIIPGITIETSPDIPLNVC